MDEQVRNATGKFVEGHPPTNNGKGGRPKNGAPTLAAVLLEKGRQLVTPERFGDITARRILDAQGKRIVDGKSVDDPDSTPNSRGAAWRDIRDTFIGVPRTPIDINPNDTDSPYTELNAYTADELSIVLATIERLRSNSASDTGGTSAARNGGADAANSMETRTD